MNTAGEQEMTVCKLLFLRSRNDSWRQLSPHSAGSFAVESLGDDNDRDAVQEEKPPALRSVSSSGSEALYRRS